MEYAGRIVPGVGTDGRTFQFLGDSGIRTFVLPDRWDKVKIEHIPKLHLAIHVSSSAAVELDEGFTLRVDEVYLLPSG